MAANSRRKWTIFTLVAIAIAAPTALTIPFAWDWLSDALFEDNSPSSAPEWHDPFFNSPFVMAGSTTPTIVAGYEAKLEDPEPVIGVEVGEHHRAYRISSFKRHPHVVNDVIERTPVTVTCCPKSQRSQVFTGDSGNAPLPIWLGGWENGEMVLKVDQIFFMQTSGQSKNAEFGNKPVFPILPHQRVTWKAWREAHPDTDVCTRF